MMSKKAPYPMSMEVLGDKCKRFESQSTSRQLIPGLPIVARLDGRAFHTFTRGLEKPYSTPFVRIMQGTAALLVEREHPDLGYVQSDEITMCWLPKGDPPFQGRVQKLESVLAGLASAKFNQLVLQNLPSKADLLPHFDCRVWNVPGLREVYECFKWRELDATKNSLSMLAYAHFSPKAMFGKKKREKHDLLHTVGVNWNDEPEWFKRGTYLRRTSVEKTLTEEEMGRIPEGRRPTGPVMRTEVELFYPQVASMECGDFLSNVLGVK